MGPLTINIAGVAALNPAMAGQVQTNPALAGLMYGSINEAVVPVEEGWVKLRGLDPAINKSDICVFFDVGHFALWLSSCCMTLSVFDTNIKRPDSVQYLLSFAPMDT